MDKQKQVDRLIKEYIGKIRKGRDCQYAKGKLPEAAKVEISNFRPMLWTRRRPRRRNEGQYSGNNPANNDDNGNGGAQEGNDGAQ